jgi:hypothetical protein
MKGKPVLKGLMKGRHVNLDRGRPGRESPVALEIEATKDLETWLISNEHRAAARIEGERRLDGCHLNAVLLGQLRPSAWRQRPSVDPEGQRAFRTAQSELAGMGPGSRDERPGFSGLLDRIE